MFLSREKIEGEMCMSAEGSSVKGSSQQSSTSFPNVKGGGPLFSGWGPLITGGLVNDTTPVYHPTGIALISDWFLKRFIMVVHNFFFHNFFVQSITK